MPLRTLLSLTLSCGLLSACGAGISADGDALSAQRFSPDALRRDLAYLKQAHASRHPRRYQTAPDARLERAFAETHAALDQPMDRAQAFRRMARVNPAFRDAHTLLMPLLSEADPDVPGEARFPLAVRLDHQGRLRVRGDWQREEDGRRIQDGTELLRINQVPAGDLLDRLASFSHGETEALQRHMLGLMFRHWLHAVEGWQGDFSVTLKEGEASIELALGGADRWTASGTKASYAPQLEFPSDQVAHLRLPTFDVDENVERYAEQVAAAFEVLRTRRPDGLIIDVRGNTGGQSDAGAEVIRYLIDRPVSFGSRARQRYNEDNNGLFGFRGAPGSMKEMDVSSDGRIDPAPESDRFHPRTVLLVDAMTYSAAILFATALQDHGLATLIGQPTGGYGNQTGNMEPVTLPHTRLLAYIPSREFVRPNGDARLAPVVPDIVVDGDESGSADRALRCARMFLGDHVAANGGPDAQPLPPGCDRREHAPAG